MTDCNHRYTVIVEGLQVVCLHCHNAIRAVTREERYNYLMEQERELLDQIENLKRKMICLEEEATVLRQESPSVICSPTEHRAYWQG